MSPASPDRPTSVDAGNAANVAGPAAPASDRVDLWGDHADLFATDPLAEARAASSAEPRARANGRRGAPLPVAAAVAALWAAVAGLLPVLAVTAIGAIGQGVPTGSVLRLATAAWLLGHGVPVQTPADRLTLVPLAITALIGWRLVRAGVHVARATGAHRTRSVGPAVVSGVAVGVCYGVVGLIVASLAGAPEVGLSVGRTAVSFALVGAGAATVGAVGFAPAGRRLALRMPRLVTDAVRTGLTAALFLLASGAAVAGAALALAGGDATDIFASFGAGAAGQAGITAICLVYLPNLAVWGTAYLLGPGFAVGVGTVVSPGDVLLGPVPALPVLAALPSAPLTGAGPALLGVPLLAGLAAGWLLSRRRAGGWFPVLGSAALAGPVAGAVVQLCAWASAGGLGSGRLSVVGPVDWRIGLFAAGVSAAGCVVGAAAARTLSRPASTS
jgi:hypothetical protein